MALATLIHPRPDGYQAFRVSPTFEPYIPMLLFRLKTGRCVALPYFALSRADFDPSAQAAAFEFGATLVELHGRHLEPLYLAVTEQVAVRVDEATGPEAALLGVTECVVEQVTVRAA